MAISPLTITTALNSAITDFVGWIKERKATMSNDNLIVGYCDHFFLMKCDRPLPKDKKRAYTDVSQL